MAIKKEKKPAAKKETAKKAAKKETKISKVKKKTEEIKEISDLIDTARELAENQIASIEITPEPEIIMTSQDAFNSINDINDIPAQAPVETPSSNNSSISDQQKALDVIANIKDRIHFNIHQREVQKEVQTEVQAEVKTTPIETVVEKSVEKKPEPIAPQLTQEQIEENLFTRFLAMRPGAMEINHFELGQTGINISRFEHLEAKIGKYKLNRIYIGGPWTVTITK